MRALHVIPSVSVVDGGPSRALAIMEGSLSAAGVEVTTVTTDDDGPSRRLAGSNRPSRANGAERVYLRKWTDLYKTCPAILPWLRRHLSEFDVVHIHALFSFSSVVAAQMAWRRRIPYVVRPLGTLTNYGLARRRPLAKRLSLSLFEERILNRAAAVQFTSTAEREEARALNLRLREAVIPLGIDAVSAKPSQELARDYPVLADRTVLLYLSRLDPKKNVEGLLEAFASLDPAGRKLVLLIAGAGEPAYVESLKFHAHALNVAEETIWLGHVDGDMKAGVLAAGDIFVLPSFSENFGIAAAEALLVGLPCVLGRGVAIAGDVEASGAGIAVDPTPRDIAQAIDRLARDDTLRGRMGEAGRELARRSYSTSAMTERLIGLYEKVALPKAPDDKQRTSRTMAENQSEQVNERKDVTGSHASTLDV